MTKIRLCPLIYKIIDYFDDYVDEDVDNTIFTADLNDLDNQDHIDNLAECWVDLWYQQSKSIKPIPELTVSHIESIRSLVDISIE